MALVPGDTCQINLMYSSIGLYDDPSCQTGGSAVRMRRGQPSLVLANLGVLRWPRPGRSVLLLFRGRLVWVFEDWMLVVDGTKGTDT